MATQDRMGVDERFRYLRMMRDRYHSEDRLGKGSLLDEMEAITGLHRKHLTARMNSLGPNRRPRKRERSRTYGPDVEKAVISIADALDWICAERLTPALPKMARHLAKFGEIEADPELPGILKEISISTVRRILKRAGTPADRLPSAPRGRRPDTLAQALDRVSIPWNEPEPGHFEVDLVHHGPSGSAGPLVYTLQFIDILTGWAERIGILGHAFDTVWRACLYFDEQCPIPVREIHTDNGGELIDLPLVSRYGQEIVHGRSNGGQSGYTDGENHVDERNGGRVRAFLADVYLNTPKHVAALNDLYYDMWLYYNFFQPILRQTARGAVLYSNGICRITRQQDQAKTPLERLFRARPPIARETADSLSALYEKTNPRALHRRIHQRLAELRRLADVDDSGTTVLVQQDYQMAERSSR